MFCFWRNNPSAAVPVFILIWLFRHASIVWSEAILFAFLLDIQAYMRDISDFLKLCTVQGTLFLSLLLLPTSQFQYFLLKKILWPVVFFGLVEVQEARPRFAKNLAWKSNNHPSRPVKMGQMTLSDMLLKALCLGANIMIHLSWTKKKLKKYPLYHKQLATFFLFCLSYQICLILIFSHNLHFFFDFHLRIWFIFSSHPLITSLSHRIYRFTTFFLFAK